MSHCYLIMVGWSLFLYLPNLSKQVVWKKKKKSGMKEELLFAAV